MRYSIVYDKPGRIRLRCGKFAFDKELEGAVAEYFCRCEAVTSAEAHFENGGMLICYKGDARGRLLEMADALDTRRLTPVKDTSENQLAKLDEDFRDNLLKHVIKRLINRAFLPPIIGHTIIVIRGLGYVWRGIKALFEDGLTVDVLDGASIGACLLQSDHETAGSIMFLLKLSGLLEEYTRARTRAALTESLAVNTDKVWLVTDGGDVLIPMEKLKVGDTVRVRTGSMIPVDGEVTEGESMVNESSMTGEPLSVMKNAGKSVFAGTVVDEGSIAVKVRALGGDTRIDCIIRLIDDSENLKAGVQSRAEQLADSIVPFSFLGFGLTLLLTRDITKAVSVLMVDYSCAIKLSTPISVISALREAAEHDMTVKGGKFLEEFAAADTVVFDKTGTLTNAEPVLEQVIAFDSMSEEDVLRTAACLEEHFPHSVAAAIVKGAADKGLIHEEEHAEVEYIVAHGIATTLHGERAVIGSRHFVQEDEGVEVTDEMQAEIDRRAGASSVIYLAIGGRLKGALCIFDPPRAEAKKAIELLKKSGIKNVVMLTGDSEKSARLTAERLGITHYESQVLPEDKHAMVEAIKLSGHRVIMVGDGINDAPALAAANVSCAMSDASDIAREAADITLRGADLTELAVLRKLSVSLMDRINANYRFIIGFNSALLALGLFSVITPAASAFLHNGSTMALCAASMRPLLKEDRRRIKCAGAVAEYA